MSSLGAMAVEFPIKDAQAAVSIAKQVCRGKANPSLAWHADLDATGKTWAASTSVTKSGDPLWVVFIPVSGPAPIDCRQSLYSLAIPRP